jgi:hypothetical protein
MTTDQDSKMIEELVDRIVQAKGQRRTGQDERRTNTVRTSGFFRSSMIQVYASPIFWIFTVSYWIG